MQIYSTKERRDIKFHDFDSIRPILMQRIDQVIDEMGLSDDMARALLIKNEWNPELAIGNFSKDPDYIQKTFGFEIGVNQVPTGDAEILCPVCFCEYGPEEFIHLQDCGHGLCQYCYTGYLDSKVGDGKGVEQTVCPEQKCNMIVPERLFH